MAISSLVGLFPSNLSIHGMRLCGLTLWWLFLLPFSSGLALGTDWCVHCSAINDGDYGCVISHIPQMKRRLSSAIEGQRSSLA